MKKIGIAAIAAAMFCGDAVAADKKYVIVKQDAYGCVYSRNTRRIETALSFGANLKEIAITAPFMMVECLKFSVRERGAVLKESGGMHRVRKAGEPYVYWVPTRFLKTEKVTRLKPGSYAIVKQDIPQKAIGVSETEPDHTKTAMILTRGARLFVVEYDPKHSVILAKRAPGDAHGYWIPEEWLKPEHAR